MRINDKVYGGGASRTGLEPKDLGGKKVALLTISRVDPEIKIPDTTRPGGVRVVCVLSFEEFEGENDRALYLNKTQVKFLIAQFGNETDRWVGKRVPLEVVKVNDVSSGKPKSKVWVADPAGKWDAIVGKPVAVKPKGKGRK